MGEREKKRDQITFEQRYNDGVVVAGTKKSMKEEPNFTAKS